AGQSIEQRQVLRDDADAFFHIDRMNDRVQIEDAERAGGRTEQAGEALDGRGLAGAVRAEEPVEAPARNDEVDPVDGDETAEHLAQAGRGKCRGGRVSQSASRCTVSGENAGTQIATYSAPPGSGLL